MTSQEIRETLHDAISSIETLYTFAVGGVANNLPLPGLSVEGVGTIALPLQETQINTLIAASEQAPFGKGADTVVDTSVRNCRQVDAKKVTLGINWQRAVQKMATDSASSLGVRGFNAVPSLYKLIIYPPGGFFKAHKDTEKEAGMFATLVVQIPSKFEDGCLVVSHMGEKKVFNFASESDSLFYSVTFYGDCEHELQTVTNGHRVCLIYNLLRTDNGPLPKLAGQDKIISQIITAAEKWESVNASHAPSKFAMLLEHEYTNKNLAFRLLKGRDAAIVSVLRLSRKFDLHLALVEKHQSGVPENSFHEHYRCGNWSDDEGAHHVMDHEIESSVDVIKWVAENDVPASLQGIRIDEEDDMLDGDCLFDEFADPDREEYEGYTGNAGPTVDYWYHRAVLVMWPKSRSMALACSASFAGGVQLALRRVQEQDPAVKATLEQVINYAKNHPEKSQGRLADLLEVACILKQIGLVCDVLQLITHSAGRSDVGCCSVKHVKLLTNAVNTFGWKELQKPIVAAVEATPARYVGNCAKLARAFARSPERAEAADVIAKAACRIFLATTLEDPAAPSMASVLFSFKSCSEEKNKFLSRVEELSAFTVSEVIHYVYKTNGDTTALKEFPEGLPQLIRVYIKKALRSKVATESYQHAVIIWSILLGPQPRDEELLDHFSKAAIETSCGKLLRELLNTPKSKSFVGDNFVTRISAARASQLNYSKPVPSNRQPYACVPRHPKVTEFLRSDRLSMEYYGFDGIRHARNFSSKHFSGGYNSVEKHSARAVPHGRGDGAYVIITKTNAFYNTLLRQYQADQEELAKVKKFLRHSPTGLVAQGLENTTSRLRQNPVVDVVDLTGD